MSKPIDIPQPSRSKSVPRTNDKQHLQVHSDSQLSYDSLTSSAGKSTSDGSHNNLNISDVYFNSGSDEYDNMRSEPVTRLKKRKSVHLKRSARVSRSFAASSGVTAFQAGLRRRSNPADYRNRKLFPFKSHVKQFDLF